MVEKVKKSLSKEELLKQHKSIIQYLKPYHYITIPEGFLPSDAIFADIEAIHETQLDKQRVEKVIDKLAKGKKFQLGEDELNKINLAVCNCLDDLRNELGLEKHNKFIAGEDIRIGNLITINSDGKIYRCSISNQQVPIGVFLRDIKKGETIEFNPNGNTKDIATYSDGVEQMMRKHKV